jgi:uncharacterized membrane protein YhhN
MSLDFSNRVLLSISVAAALVYLTGWLPFPAQVLAKGLTVSILAIIAFRCRQPLLGLALSFGSLGDVLLDLDPARLFVFGLGAFLLGHLTYITLFVRRRLSRHDAAPLSKTRRAIVAFLLVYIIAFSVWLSPSLGALAAPVYAYMGAITLMAMAAGFAGFRRPWVVAGAICFVASDSILGAAKFAGGMPGRDFLVWSTYCLAQYGLTLGCLAESGYGADTTSVS